MKDIVFDHLELNPLEVVNSILVDDKSLNVRQSARINIVEPYIKIYLRKTVAGLLVKKCLMGKELQMEEISIGMVNTNYSDYQINGNTMGNQKRQYKI